MATVSSGTFFAIVSANAAIRAIYKNQGLNIGFAKDFLIRLNYPGVIRFALACKADAKFISEDILIACQKFMEKHNKQYIEKDIRCCAAEHGDKVCLVISVGNNVLIADNAGKTAEEDHRCHHHNQYSGTRKIIAKKPWDKIFCYGKHAAGHGNIQDGSILQRRIEKMFIIVCLPIGDEIGRIGQHHCDNSRSNKCGQCDNILGILVKASLRLR